MSNHSISRPEYAGMVKASELGLVIAAQFPEIAQDYRDGLSIRHIVESRRIAHHLNITDAGLAENATRFAITGCDERYGLTGYVGLIDDAEELRQLRQRRGFELRSKYARIADMEKRGLRDRLTSEELSSAAKRGLESQGKILAVERRYDELLGATFLGEYDYLWLMYHSPSYRHEGGSKHKGRLDVDKVRQEINRLFHGGKEVRTKYGINCMMRRAVEKKRREMKNN